ncbi:chemosensory receptor C [Elysia marginata]|uniref:Chemosensory receptor C n=1 Tax=Elysia marginata TaxID=1093978 RepID=A0AAV4GTR6_9GAST|nr:chemosensory receptor C [Elysia marginata]
MAGNLTDAVDSQTDWIFLHEVLFIKKFIFHIMIGVAAFGVAANSINVLTFVKMKLKDNVTITLLALSISDLLFVLMRSCEIISKFLAEKYPQLGVPSDDHILLFSTLWLAQLFYDYSSFVSVFLAVVRCACVARPLRFKSMFTKSRTIILLGVLFIIPVMMNFPILTIVSLGWVLNPNTNSTFLSVRFVENYYSVYMTSDIVNRNVLAWLTYITVVTCATILTCKLLTASRFRRSLVSGPTGGSEKGNRTVARVSGPPGCNPEPFERSEKSPGKIPTKELQPLQKKGQSGGVVIAAIASDSRSGGRGFDSRP